MTKKTLLLTLAAIARLFGVASDAGPGELVEQLRADARALWSVRVLDAWAASQPGRDPIPSPNRTELGEWWIWFRTGQYYIGPTPDAARHAAALAVFPTLPADARAALGECPK